MEKPSVDTAWRQVVKTPAGEVVLQGRVEPGFAPVADAFVTNFAERGEVGASVALHCGGREVVALWGGLADPADARAWDDQTVSIIFSATKPATALCIHLLAERGLIDLDAPVAGWWPEFGCNGKDAITVRMVLDHTAGLPVLAAPLKPDCLCDHAYMAERLAVATPLWEPGTRTAYHPVMGGFILAELVRRIDGRSLGRFFAEDVAEPLGLAYWIGLPEALEPRVAPIIAFRPPKGAELTRFGTSLRDPASLQSLFLFNHGDWQSKGVNSRAGRAAEIGAASGVTNAMSLARLYEALRPGGALGLTKARIESFSQASSATHLDGMLLQPTRFGPGFMLRIDNRAGARGDSFLIGPRAFGHVGAGGSFGMRDPDADLSMAYTMNRMGPGFLLNPRGQSLIDAAYACLGR